MPYFRVSYDGYIEDNFEDSDEAFNAFIDHITDPDTHHISIEKFDEEIGEWVVSQT